MTKFIIVCAWLLIATALSAQPTDTLTLVHYNLLKYGDNGCIDISVKNSRFKTIFDYLRPDVLAVNEITPNTAVVNNLRAGALTFNPAMQATTFGNSSGSNLVNMLYYNSNKLGYLSHTAITGNVRDVDVYRLYHKASTKPGDTTDIWFFVAHLKASIGYEADRAATTLDITNWLQNRPQVQRYVLDGDLNIYSSTEPAYQNLLTRFKDPTGVTNGWGGYQYAAMHTQSPATGADPCAVTGGMDDRFDFFLTSPAIYSGLGKVAYLPASYRAVGNDGNSYNTSLNCTNNASVPATVCNALRSGSDHLPVVMQLTISGTSAIPEPPGANAFQLIGNPVSSVLRISCPEDREYTWKISDVYGKINQTGRSSVPFLPMLEIMVPQLTAGFYFISLQSASGQTVTLKFLKTDQ